MHDHRYHAVNELSREDGHSAASSLILLICEPILILSGGYLAVSYSHLENVDITEAQIVYHRLPEHLL